MTISSFDDLLRAARHQPEPQRLLFVFARAELPDDSTAEQRAAFEARQGGTLTPLMSVDKSPDELETFGKLAEESRQFGDDWDLLFVAALSGRDDRGPTMDEAEQSLQRMIEAVKTGAFGAFMTFDRRGEPLMIEREP
jgi:hypothetical protein